MVSTIPCFLRCRRQFFTRFVVGAFHRNYVHFLEREMNWSRSNIKGAKFQIFSTFYMCYDIVNRHFCYSHKFNSLHKRQKRIKIVLVL